MSRGIYIIGMKTTTQTNYAIVSDLELGNLDLHDLCDLCEALDVEVRDHADGNALLLGGVEVYWDEQDPANVGWAYRSGDESGPLDTLADLLSALGA